MRNRNLKEILSPSLYTKNKNEKNSYVSYVIKNCGKRDICRNYLISDNTSTCKVTNMKHFINNDLDIIIWMLYILLAILIVMNNI